MNSPFKAHLMLSFTAISSALNYSISKIIMPGFLSPAALLVCRGIVCILFFKLFHFFSVKEKVDPHDFIRILFCAALGVVINQICFYEGLNLTRPINASLIMASTPIIVFILSALSAAEAVSTQKIMGVAIGASGTALILISGKSSFEQVFWGDIYMLINAISWAGYLILIKPLVKKYHPITILKWNFLLGFAVIFPYGVSDFIKVSWSGFTPEAWWALLYVMIFASVLNYYFNSAVMEFVNPSSASSYIYLQPILAAIFAVLLGKDQITLNTIFSLILVLTGIFLINLDNNQHTKKTS